MVDIVFVHGLYGDPHETWTAEESKTFWPAQLLPSFVEEEKARILTYGYDAHMSSFIRSQSSKSLANHAKHLLAELVENRQMQKADERPLIFVAHSLGGLLVKQALIYSAEEPGEHLRSIFVSTYGILFLGTPHKVFNVREWGLRLERIGSAVLPRKLIDRQPLIMDAFKENIKSIQDIDRCFLPLMNRFRIYIFREGRPTNVKGILQYIVDEESASPMLQDFERASIDTVHSHMSKFENDSAPGFDLVVEGIQRYASDAPSDIAARWKVEKAIQDLKIEQEQETVSSFSSSLQNDISQNINRPASEDFDLANADSLRRSKNVETWNSDLNSEFSDIKTTGPNHPSRRLALSVEERDMSSSTGPRVAIEDPADTRRFGDSARREGKKISGEEATERENERNRRLRESRDEA